MSSFLFMTLNRGEHEEPVRSSTALTEAVIVVPKDRNQPSPVGVLPPSSSIDLGKQEQLLERSRLHEAWRQQIASRGFAKCPFEKCSLCLASVSSIARHFEKCKGYLNPGDYVECPDCHHRFKTFSLMQLHRTKAHANREQQVVAGGHPATPAGIVAGVVDIIDSRPRETDPLAMPANASNLGRNDPDFRAIFNLPGSRPSFSEKAPRLQETRQLSPDPAPPGQPNRPGNRAAEQQLWSETPEQMQERILAASAEISIARRPRGRPRKTPLPVAEQEAKTKDQGAAGSTVVREVEPTTTTTTSLKAACPGGAAEAVGRVLPAKVCYDRKSTQQRRKDLAELEMALNLYEKVLSKYDALTSEGSAQRGQELKELEVEVQAREAEACRKINEYTSSMQKCQMGGSNHNNNNNSQSSPSAVPLVQTLKATASSSDPPQSPTHFGQQRLGVVRTSPNPDNLMHKKSARSRSSAEDDNYSTNSSVRRGIPTESLDPAVSAAPSESLAETANNGEVGGVPSLSVIDPPGVCPNLAEASSLIKSLPDGQSAAFYVAKKSSLANNPISNRDGENDQSKECNGEVEEEDLSCSSGQTGPTLIGMPKRKRSLTKSQFEPETSFTRRKSIREESDGRTSANRSSNPARGKRPRKSLNDERAEMEATSIDGSTEKLEDSLEKAASEERLKSCNGSINVDEAPDSADETTPLIKATRRRGRHKKSPAHEQVEQEEPHSGKRSAKRGLKDRNESPPCIMAEDSGVLENHSCHIAQSIPDEAAASEIKPARRGRPKKSLSKEQHDEVPDTMAAAAMSRRRGGVKRKRPESDKLETEGPRTAGGKRGSSEVKVAKKVKCGVCQADFKTVNAFEIHAIKVHGCLARPQGEKQEFDEAEALEAIRKGLQRKMQGGKAKVPCYRCKDKRFVSFRGIQLHLDVCGKSEEDVEGLKVKCPRCDFRTFPHCIKPHLNVHLQEDDEERRRKMDDDQGPLLGDDDDGGDPPDGGPPPSAKRRRRTAAQKAGQLLSKLTRLEEDLDGDDPLSNQEAFNDDDDDGADGDYNFVEDLDADLVKTTPSSSSSKRKNGRWVCKACDFVAHSSSAINAHVLDNHADEDDEDEIDAAGEDEDGLDLDDGAEGQDDIDVDQGGRRRRKFQKDGRKSSKKERGNDALIHDEVMASEEAEFRREHFASANEGLFPNLHTRAEDWTVVQDPVDLLQDDPNIAKRSSSRSVEFRVKGCWNKKADDGGESSSSEKRFRSLERFEASWDELDSNVSATLYAGGPIHSCDWAPAAPRAGHAGDDSVLAVASDLTFDKFISVMNNTAFAGQSSRSSSSPAAGLIQLWSLPQLKSAKDMKPDSRPTLEAAIVHNFGRVWSLQWCHSGCRQQKNPSTAEDAIDGRFLPRRGILAAACEDGTIRLLSVPELVCLRKLASSSGQQQQEVVVNNSKLFFALNPNKVVTLTRRASLGQPGGGASCLKVVWFKCRGHRVLAGSFSDGIVALWDLNTQSSLLKVDTTVGEATTGLTLLPYIHFRAHKAWERTSLDLSSEWIQDDEDEDEEEYHRGRMPRFLITGSTDKSVCLWDLAEPSLYSGLWDPVKCIQRFPVTDTTLLHNHRGFVHVAHDECYSVLTRSFAVDLTRMDSGTVSTFFQSSAVLSQAFCPIKNVAFSSTSAGEVVAYLFRRPYCRQAMKNDKLSPHRHCYIYRSVLVRKDVVPSGGGEDPAQVGSDLDGGCRIEFVDMPLSNFRNIPKDEMDGVKQMGAEDFLVYPLLQINKVCVSPDLAEPGWVFSGGQSGLGRIHYIKSIE